MANPTVTLYKGPVPISTGSTTLTVAWRFSTRNSKTKKWTEQYKEDKTENFEVVWSYTMANGLEYIGSSNTVSYMPYSYTNPTGDANGYRYWTSNYSIPEGAKKVYVKIKPISKTYQKQVKGTTQSGGNTGALKEIVVDGIGSIGKGGTSSSSTTYTTTTTESYFKGAYCAKKSYNTSNVSLTYEGDLTATLALDKTAINVNYTTTNLSAVKYVKFNCIKNGSATKCTSTWIAIDKTGHASFRIPSLANGSKYEVRAKICGSAKNNESSWSKFSEPVYTKPDTPTWVSLGASKVNRETGEYQIKAEWKAPTNPVVANYTFEYAEDKGYFDVNPERVNSFDTSETSKSNYVLRDLDSAWIGKLLYFRFRANGLESGGAQYPNSNWSSIKSIRSGFKPEPPTTWSTTESARIGEHVTLMWTHNSVDGSEQENAIVNYRKNGGAWTNISNLGTQKYYEIPASLITSDCKFEWRVQTRGAYIISGGEAKDYWSDYSITRCINFYSSPSAEIMLNNLDEDDIMHSFPLSGTLNAYPSNQKVLSYYISIRANDYYTNVSALGDTITIQKDQIIFQRIVDLDASDNSHTFDFEIGANEVDLITGMSYTVSGSIFTDSGSNADSEIIFETDFDIVNLSCAQSSVTCNLDTITAEILPVCYTTDLDENDEVVYILAENVTLSVYRIAYDGSNILIEDNIENTGSYVIVDPHPSLNIARYRVVARDNETGYTTYDDIESILEFPFAMIQWDEESSYYDINSANDITDNVSYTGNILVLSYNLDVSESYDKDTANINYIGRESPVAYYGTQLGITSSWSCLIPKNDTETLLALRKLSKYMGDVYVREPGGLGYWANISISFSRTHLETTIPVSIEITKVEGGK